MLVQTITGDLLSKLRVAGIKEQTIGKHYACFYRSFCKEAGDKELGEDLIVSFLINTREKDIWNLPYYQLSRREQICRNAFHVLLEYQITGRLEVKTRRKDVLIIKDETVMNEYISLCVEAGNAERTYIRKKAAIRRFLTVSSLEDINSAAIQSYVYSFAGKSTYYQKRELDEIRKFLGFCFLQKYISDDFGTEFPDIRAVNDSRLPSVYTNEEIKRLLLHLAKRESVNKLRDYAMVLLMAVYGFRSVDISSFCCDNLDLKNGTTRFLQSKTGTAISHKILPHVGNAITDYILNERPCSSSRLLFLKADGMGLCSKSVSSVVRNAFLSCDIDIGKRKYGSHCLRYSLATSMINNGHSIFTVANVLGQTSAETARLYSKVDISRLSRCSLEVPSNE